MKLSTSSSHRPERRLETAHAKPNVLKQLSFLVSSPAHFDYAREVLEPLAVGFTELGEYPVNGDLAASTVEALMQNLDYGMNSQSADPIDTLKPLVALVSMQPLTPALMAYYGQVLVHCYEYVDHDEWERAVSLLPNIILDEMMGEPLTPAPLSARTQKNLSRVPYDQLSQLRAGASEVQAHVIAAHVQSRIVDASLGMPKEVLKYAKELRMIGETSRAQCAAHIAKIRFSRERDFKGEKECRKFLGLSSDSATVQTNADESCDIADGMPSVKTDDLIKFSIALREIDAKGALQTRVAVQEELLERDPTNVGVIAASAFTFLKVGDYGRALDAFVRVLTLIKGVLPPVPRDVVSQEQKVLVTLSRDFIEPLQTLAKELVAESPQPLALKSLPTDKLIEAAEMNEKNAEIERALYCYAVLYTRSPISYKFASKLGELLSRLKRYDDSLAMCRGTHAIIELGLLGYGQRGERIRHLNDEGIKSSGAVNEVRMRTIEVLSARRKQTSGTSI